MSAGRISRERVPSGEIGEQGSQVGLDIANVAGTEPAKPTEQILIEALDCVPEVGEVTEMQEPLGREALQLLFEAVADHRHELAHAGLARQVNDRRRGRGSVRGCDAGG